MRMILFIVTFLIALASSPTFASPTPVPSLFGTRILPRTDFHEPFLTADFDGDGVPDQVYLVKILPKITNTTIMPDVTAQSFWGDSTIDPKGETLALAIVQGKSGRKFLIHGANFFSSDIWQVHDIDLHVALRGSKEMRGFASHVRKMRNDIIVVGTEAGIDTALYFDGSKYALYEPPEEP